MSSSAQFFCSDCGHLLFTQIADSLNLRMADYLPCQTCGGRNIRGGVLVQETRVVSSSPMIAGGAVTKSGSWAQFHRGWIGQYNRMRRSYSRLWGVAPPTPHFIGGQVEDDFVHFFQDAWHLKDWLKHDPATTKVVSDIEYVVNGSIPLALTADLANGSKHLGLTRSRTGDLTTDANTLSLGGDPTVGLIAKLEIQSGGQTFDAVTVATDAIAAWDAYLKGKGLLA